MDSNHSEPDSQADLSESAEDLQDLIVKYIDRMNDGEKLDRNDILAEQPYLGQEIIEHLETFIEFGSTDGETPPLGTLGDYTLRRQIGRGGMGVVYEAWQNSMDRRVALKVLPAGIAADTRACARFMREAQAAGKLSHQNVVHVHGMGVEEKIPYYAMEYVDGETLAQVLVKIKDAEPETDTSFGRQDDIAYFGNIARAFANVADGLQHAHSKGVIHRDIKPSNLILDHEGRLRILDFGLARLEGQESITISGDVVGTPLYMSPEQARRRKIEVDHRTDVYSLGATMYEALCGRPPFRGKDHADTLSQIIEWDPLDVRRVNPRVPKDLETISLKCLRKEADDRYGTAEALAQDLRRFVRGDPIEARPQSALEKLTRRLWKHRWRLAASAVACVLLIVTGFLLYRHAKTKQKQDRDLYEDRVVSAALALPSLALLEGDPGGDIAILSRTMTHMTRYYLPRIRTQPGKGPLNKLLGSLNEAVELRLPRPEAHYYKARVLGLLKRDAEASAELDRAIEQSPGFVPAQFLKARLLRRLGDTAGADGVLNDLRDYEPGTWQFQWLKAYEALQRFRWRRVARAFDTLYLTYMDQGEPYLGAAQESFLARAKARLETGDYHSAIEDFIAARAHWPRSTATDLFLGAAYAFANNCVQSERTFRRLCRASHETDEAILLISHMYFQSHRFRRSMAWINRISVETVRRTWLARCLLREKLPSEAEVEARKAVGCDPTFLPALYIWGLALASLERYEDSERAFRRILDLDRDYVLALQELGWVLCQLDRADEGMAFLRRAIALSRVTAMPSSRTYADLLVLLAKAQFQQGQGSEAVRLLEQVCRLPQRPLHRASWYLEEELAKYRNSILPELPSYQSVDAALEALDQKVIIREDAEWRFFRGTKEPSREWLAWARSDFDDGDWPEGPGGFGYGEGDHATVLNDMKGRYTTLYIRRYFEVADPTCYDRFVLRVYADNAFVAYLNGREVARVGVREGIRWLTHDTMASVGTPEPPVPTDVVLPPHRFRAGLNVLAIQGFNFGLHGSDFSLIPTLAGERMVDFSQDVELLEACSRVHPTGTATACLAYLEGRISARAKRYSEAVECFRRAIAMNDAAPQLFWHLADALRSLGNPAQAEKVLHSALEEHFPDSRDLWELWIATSLGDPELAPAEILDRVPLRRPRDSSEETGEDPVPGYVQDLLWLLQELKAGRAVRINCGHGKEFRGSDGRLWTWDRFFYGGRRNGPREFGLDIENTDDDTIYVTERWFSHSRDRQGYRIPLPPGTYHVTLHFADFYFGIRVEGRRAFNVLIEDETILEEYQPKSKQAETRDFDIRIEDGCLDIEFVHGSANHPNISAIEIYCLE